ncbi:MAG: rhodanese-like domain-containing protein [Lachnospiraceae bacterium]|nr:rhodanese-like domain-containing protein [Lachnospiraceae bacterium]
MQVVLTEREAAQIAARAANPKLRDPRGIRIAERIPAQDPAADDEPKRIRIDDPERLYSFRVIDVREPEEYAEGHVPGAVNIPLAQCLLAPDTLAESRDERLCFICAKGIKSRLAAAAAIQAGYTEAVYAGMDPLP